MFRNIKFNMAFAAIIGLVLILGCNKRDYSTNPGSGTPPQEIKSVTIDNFAFSPSSIKVAVGDTVTWTNKQIVNHTVTSDQGNELNSPLIAQNQTYKHIFTTAGTYAYHCQPHPNMKGSVKVE